jgi:5-methylcytosine-specific restriction endonuclease McrA
VLACELAWEVHIRSYWSQVRRSNGTPYENEEAYFREVLRLTSWRTAYKRLAIGRVLTSFVESERALLRMGIAEVGLAKATIIAPAIERLGDWQTWLGWAARECTVALQRRVSAALEALPRGREPSPPGERFRRTVMSAMPDIEAMELVDQFFAVGAKVVGTVNPVAIFLAGCRECLPEWELQANRPRRPADHAQDSQPSKHLILPTWANLGSGVVLRRRSWVGRAAAQRVRAGGPRALGRRAASYSEWASIRTKVLSRAGWCCQACGVWRGLDIHHVVKRSQGGSDFDLDQLVALCRWCHDQTDAPYERGRLTVNALGDGQFRFELITRTARNADPDFCPRGQRDGIR